MTPEGTTSTDPFAAAPAQPAGPPAYYCDQCGARYHGPGVCSNQHEPRQLSEDPDVAPAPIGDDPPAVSGDPPTSQDAAGGSPSLELTTVTASDAGPVDGPAPLPGQSSPDGSHVSTPADASSATVAVPPDPDVFPGHSKITADDRDVARLERIVAAVEKINAGIDALRAELSGD